MSFLLSLLVAGIGLLAATRYALLSIDTPANGVTARQWYAVAVAAYVLAMILGGIAIWLAD